MCCAAVPAPSILDGGAGRGSRLPTGTARSGVECSTWPTGLGSGGEAQGDSYVAIENVNGSQGADTLVGNGGVNVLNGFAGADTLRGGGAMDQLTGGAGADSFVYGAIGDSPSSAAGRDLITDFSHAQGDRIDLSLIDANTGVAGDQAFHRSSAPGLFTGVAGQLHTWIDAGGRPSSRATSTATRWRISPSPSPESSDSGGRRLRALTRARAAGPGVSRPAGTGQIRPGPPSRKRQISWPAPSRAWTRRCRIEHPLHSN